MITWINSLKTKRIALGLFVAAWFALSGFSLSGCGDDYSDEAKMYDAVQALDDGDWARARAILATLPETEQVLQYLSNCDTGEVGINTFDLLSIIDDMDNENSGDGESGDIDMIGKLIGSDDNYLTCEAATEKLNLMIRAIGNFNTIMNNYGPLDNDQAVQLGIASLTRTVVIIAKLICETPGIDTVSMTKTWIRAHRDDFLDITSATWDSSPVTATYAEMLGEDIANVGNAIQAMTDDNEIQEDFDAFRTKLDNGEGAGVSLDGVIDLDEMNAYLGDM